MAAAYRHGTVKRRIFALSLSGALFVTPLVLLGACDNASLVAPGGACFQSIDCQLGYACVPQPNDAGGVCSNDLSKIATVPEAGADMTVADTTPMMDSPVMDQVAQDNNVPETSNMDTGTPETGTTDASGD